MMNPTRLTDTITDHTRGVALLGILLVGLGAGAFLLFGPGTGDIGPTAPSPDTGESPSDSTGLIAHWSFDDADSDSTAFTDEVNGTRLQAWSGEDGTGSMTVGEALVDGVSGSGLNLCAGCYFDHTSDPDRLSHSEMAIAFWVRPAGTSGPDSDTGILTGETYDSNPTYAIMGGIPETNQLIFARRSSESVEAAEADTTSWSEDTWYHVVAQNSADELELYIDGQRVDAWPISDGARIETEIDELKIPDSDFTGDIDELRIYDRTLSQDEIADLATR